MSGYLDYSFQINIGKLIDLLADYELFFVRQNVSDDMEVMYNNDYMERKGRERRSEGHFFMFMDYFCPSPSSSKIESGVDIAVTVAIQPMPIVIHIVI